MYSTVRLLLVVPVACIIGLLLHRKKRFNRNSAIILFVISLVLFYGIRFVPVERYFLKFDTPEAAFCYGYDINDKSFKTICFSNCAVIIYSEDGEKTDYAIVKKDGEQWMFTSPYTEEFDKTVYSHDKFFIDKLEIGDKKMIFVNTLTSISNFTVSDNKNNEFIPYSLESCGIDGYYSLMKTDMMDYVIILDGESVPINH